MCVLALSLLALLGCRQAMEDQPRYDPLETSAFFQDGRASRPSVPGTVPRSVGRLQDEKYDEHLTTGRVDGELATLLPETLLERQDTRELLRRGRERFDIYCAPCHDLVGTGNGIVPQRGFPFPPTYHSERLRDMPLGHFFVVMTDGYRRMPDYGKQIPAADRWAIAAYIRALQLSQHARIDELSEEDRRELSAP